ncbi:hypothetical protein Tco_0731372 [Tanacetum coccineum]
MPLTLNLSFIGLDEFVNKPVVENCKAMSSDEETKVVTKNDDAPIIEEWLSDDEEEDVSQPKFEKKTIMPSIVKKDFVKSKQQEKTARKSVKQGNPQMDLQDQGVIDNGCSRHMTGNMSYLTDYEEIDGGYVAFGGNPKGGKITRKCTIKTSNLDFENIHHFTKSNSSQDDGSNLQVMMEKKVNEYPRKDSESIDQENDDNVNSTNNLQQALRAWYETLSTYLLDNGFERGKIDKTLIQSKEQRSILLVKCNGEKISSLVSTNRELCNTFEKLMQEKFSEDSNGRTYITS